MEYIRVTKDNLDKEHICCAISNNTVTERVMLSSTALLMESEPVKMKMKQLKSSNGQGIEGDSELLLTGSGRESGRALVSQR